MIMSNKNLTIHALSKVSIPAAALLAWAEAVIVWHEGRKLFGSEESGRIGGLKPNQNAWDQTGGTFVAAKEMQLSESRAGIPVTPPKIERPPTVESNIPEPTLDEISSMLRSNRAPSVQSEVVSDHSDVSYTNRPPAEMDDKLADFRRIKKEED